MDIFGSSKKSTYSFVTFHGSGAWFIPGSECCETLGAHSCVD